MKLENEVNKFLSNIADCLIKEYSYDSNKAQQAVMQSTLYKVIWSDTEVAMHYIPSYWANCIVDEIEGNSKLSSIEKHNNDDEFMSSLLETGKKINSSLKLDNNKINRAIKEFRRECK